MKQLTPKQAYLLQKAKDVYQHQLLDPTKHIKGQELVVKLNKNGFLTNYNTKYVGGRGVYRLIKSTYDACIANNSQSDADLIAGAFKKANGKFAYK